MRDRLQDYPEHNPHPDATGHVVCTVCDAVYHADRGHDCVPVWAITDAVAPLDDPPADPPRCVDCPGGGTCTGACDVPEHASPREDLAAMIATWRRRMQGTGGRAPSPAGGRVRWTYTDQLAREG